MYAKINKTGIILWLDLFLTIIAVVSARTYCDSDENCRFNAKCVFRRNQRGVCQCQNNCNNYQQADVCALTLEDEELTFCELEYKQCLIQKALPFQKIGCDGENIQKSKIDTGSVFTDEEKEKYLIYYRIVDNSECENRGISIISMSGDKALDILQRNNIKLSRKNTKTQQCYCMTLWQGEFCQWEDTTVGSVYIIFSLSSVLIAFFGLRKIHKKKRRKKQEQLENSSEMSSDDRCEQQRVV